MNESNQIKIKQSVRGKKSNFFSSEGVDELMAICITLAQEIWVLKEQMASYEDILSKKLNVSESKINSQAAAAYEQFRMKAKLILGPLVCQKN